MSWANLDDRLHAHPKVRRLQRIPFAGAEALGIWAWCLSWCRAYAPADGRLDPEDVAIDWNTSGDHMRDVFQLLVSVRLMDAITQEPGGDTIGYVIHDWGDWQLSPQQKGGLARAQNASRIGGRFAQEPTSKLGHLASAGPPPGHQEVSNQTKPLPLQTSPSRAPAPAGAGAAASARASGATESEFRQRVPRPGTREDA